MVLEAISRYLSRVYTKLNRLSQPSLRAIFLMCVVKVVPDQYRTGAIGLGLHRAVAQRVKATSGLHQVVPGRTKAPTFSLESTLPFCANSDGALVRQELSLPAGVPDIYADLYVDDIFSFTFSGEALKETTAAHRQLLKYIVSQWTMYTYGTIATLDERFMLAKALKCLHASDLRRWAGKKICFPPSRKERLNNYSSWHPSTPQYCRN